MADTIKIGNLDISAFKVGSDDCKVYLGDILLYPQSPTPPAFQGKWLTTYTGGTTSSAECDSTSAITLGEITLTDLVSVEIGDCVTNIGDYAFSGCTSLTNCTLGSGVTSIGGSAFWGCTSITSIDIPDSVTEIGSRAFRSCSSLTSIVIPSGVTSIGDNAFNSCHSLTSCTIGSGVTTIGNFAFRYCTSLTSVDIPNSVTSFGNSTFRQCTNLRSVTIGNGVTSIGSYVFRDCTNLQSVTIKATTPPTLSNANSFKNTNNCPIYVPASSISTYKSANNWSSLSSRIQAIPNS